MEPILFAGYFLAGNVQPVAMCNQESAIDLVVVFFRKPGKDLPWDLVQSIDHRLRQSCKEASVLSGKQARNAWIVLSVRRSLLEVAPDMRVDEAELLATYEQLHSWCGIIFSDPKVEAAMRETWKTGW